MAKAKYIWEKDYMSHIGGTIMLFLTFAALGLSVPGTPLGQLMVKRDPSDYSNTKMCYTLWGIRPNCWSAHYSWRVEEETCMHRLYRWQAAEAFSIVALFSLFFQLFAAYYVLENYNLKLTVILMSCFSIATSVVPWAVITSFYCTNFCGQWHLTHVNTNLGDGYKLLVSSTAVQVVSLILFVFLEPEYKKKRNTLDDVEVKDV